MICETHLALFGFHPLLWCLDGCFYFWLCHFVHRVVHLVYVASLGVFVLGLVFIGVYISFAPSLLCRKFALRCLVLRSIAVYISDVSWRLVCPSGTRRSFPFFLIILSVGTAVEFHQSSHTSLSFPCLAGFALLWRSCSALYILMLLLFH